MQIIKLEGDKSLSHRYLIFEYLSGRKCQIKNLSSCDDVQTTRNCLNQISQGIKELDCKNSGTTIRLLAGMISGSELSKSYLLTGDNSLKRRPMQRIIEPLSKLGVEINSYAKGMTAPFEIVGQSVSQISSINIKIPSAQVKSSLLLFALCANRELTLTGAIESRDHTEIFLKNQNLNIRKNDNTIYINDSFKSILPFNIDVPGDPSSAIFLMIASILSQNTHEYLLKSVSLNPTRIEYIRLLKEMNCNIHLSNQHYNLGELVGDITVSYTPLSSIRSPENLDSFNTTFLIDEFPILSILFSQLKGTVLIKNLSELRVKESDRLKGIKELLSHVCPECQVVISKDSLSIGYGNFIESHDFKSNDHRILMSYFVSQKVIHSKRKPNFEEKNTVKISYPNFFKDISLI